MEGYMILTSPPKAEEDSTEHPNEEFGSSQSKSEDCNLMNSAADEVIENELTDDNVYNEHSNLEINSGEETLKETAYIVSFRVEKSSIKKVTISLSDVGFGVQPSEYCDSAHEHVMLITPMKKQLIPVSGGDVGHKLSPPGYTNDEAKIEVRCEGKAMVTNFLSVLKEFVITLSFGQFVGTCRCSY
jgi:hypothetical protein